MCFGREHAPCHFDRLSHLVGTLIVRLIGTLIVHLAGTFDCTFDRHVDCAFDWYVDCSLGCARLILRLVFTLVCMVGRGVGCARLIFTFGWYVGFTFAWYFDIIFGWHVDCTFDWYADCSFVRHTDCTFDWYVDCNIGCARLILLLVFTLVCMVGLGFDGARLILRLACTLACTVGASRWSCTFDFPFGWYTGPDAWSRTVALHGAMHFGTQRAHWSRLELH